MTRMISSNNIGYYLGKKITKDDTIRGKERVVWSLWEAALKRMPGENGRKNDLELKD